MKDDTRHQIVALGITLSGCLLSFLFLSTIGILNAKNDPEQAVVFGGTTPVTTYGILRFVLAYRPKWFR